MGMVPVNTFLVRLESMPNCHSENPVAFRLIFVVEIQQRLPQVHHSTQNVLFLPIFRYENMATGCLIFTAKIQQSFAISALWHTDKVPLCIRRISTYSHRDESKPFKASSMLMRVAYTRKSVSLGDMDQDNHTVIIVHTV